MREPSDLVQGTSDLLLLKILAFEPLNGWAISQRLTQVSSVKPTLNISGEQLDSVRTAAHAAQRLWLSPSPRSLSRKRRRGFNVRITDGSSGVRISLNLNEAPSSSGQKLRAQRR